MEDVSKLLGCASIPVTDKYDAPLFASRNLRLERFLSETPVNTNGNGFGYRERCVTSLPVRTAHAL